MFKKTIRLYKKYTSKTYLINAYKSFKLHISKRFVLHALIRWFISNPNLSPAILLILIPNILSVFYFTFIASNMYISKASFVVQHVDHKVVSPIEAMMGGMSLTGSSNSHDALVVKNYMYSEEIMHKIDEAFDLKKLYSNRKYDFISRLSRNPTKEEFLSYYKSLLKTFFDPLSGVMEVEFKAYTPEDSKKILDNILELSEDLVERLSEKSRRDSLEFARKEVSIAEDRVKQAINKLRAFKEDKSDIDPAASAGGMMKILSEFQSEKIKAEGELAESLSFLQDNSPKVNAIKNKIKVLSNQIEEIKNKLTDCKGDSMNLIVSDFEMLMLEKDFAEKGYASALASLESARMDSNSRHTYLVNFVNPSVPEESLYPSRTLATLSFFFISLLVYGIGFLIIAAIKEHMTF